MFSVLIGKVLLFVTRMRGGGSALPGLFVERRNPRFLAGALGGLKYGVVLISGTNGKTTTTKMVAELLRGAGVRVFTNDNAGNFVRGVISAILQHSNWRGKLEADIAILELDEAHAQSFMKLVEPDYSLLLNVLPDQTDRFGSTENVAKLLYKIADATKKKVVTNRDDKYLDKIKNAIYFGEKEADAISRKITLKIGGSYNYMNAAAALALVREILPKVGDEVWLEKLAEVEPAVGRGEKIGDVEIILVKNQDGFRLALQSYTENFPTLIAMNNQYADGRDASWLESVDFSSLGRGVEEQFRGRRSKGKSGERSGGYSGWRYGERGIITSGTCGAEVVRILRKQGVKNVKNEENLRKAVNLLLEKQGEKYIFCSYTAMLGIRKILVGRRG